MWRKIAFLLGVLFVCLGAIGQQGVFRFGPVPTIGDCAVWSGSNSIRDNGESCAPLVFNISSFGAVCDGVTDDTIPIRNAVAAWKNPVSPFSITVLVGLGRGKKCKVTGTIDFTNLFNTSPVDAVVRDLYLYGVFNYKGPIGTLGTITGGAGYVPGVYINVPLTGGTGNTCTATSVTVNGGGAVSAIVLSSPGCGLGYTTGDTLSASNVDLGGAGAGFSVPVATLSGGAVIDAIGSRFVQWTNVTIEGDCANVPNTLMAIGRIDNNSADYHQFVNFKGVGCWQFAAMYNFASESLLLTGGFISSSSAAGAYYGLVQDGMNHFNWSSTNKVITAAIDTPRSFNSNLFNSMNILVNASAAATGIWIGKANGHSFYGSYVAASGNCAINLYSLNNTTRSSQLVFDLHVEAGAVVNAFCIDGTETTPALVELTYKDFQSFPTSNTFSPISSILSVTAFGLDVKIASMPVGATVYGAPLIWTVTPIRIEVPTAGNYVAPGTSRAGGQICFGSAACTPS